MRWEGDHLRIVLTVNDSKAIDKLIVSELSAKLRKIGCRYVLDDGRNELFRCSLSIAFSNRFCSLKNDDVTIKKCDCEESFTGWFVVLQCLPSRVWVTGRDGYKWLSKPHKIQKSKRG